MRFTKQLKCAVVLAIVGTLPGCDQGWTVTSAPVRGGCKGVENLVTNSPADPYRTVDFLKVHNLKVASVPVHGVVFKKCVLVEGKIIRSDDPRQILEIMAERHRDGAASRDIYGQPVDHASKDEQNSINNGGVNNKVTAGGIKNNSLDGTTGGGTTGGDTGGDTGGTTGGSTNNSGSEPASAGDLGLGTDFPPLPGTK